MASSYVEHRRFPRRRVKGRARIQFDETSIDCFIVDQSDGGVGLLLRDGDTIPDTFSLHVEPARPRRAEIVWRGYPRCGAVFRD